MALFMHGVRRECPPSPPWCEALADAHTGPGLGENKGGISGKLAVIHLASLVGRDPQGSALVSLLFVQGVLGRPRAAIVVVCVFPKECGEVLESWSATAFSIFEWGCRMGARGTHVGREHCGRFRPTYQDQSRPSTERLHADTCALIALVCPVKLFG